MTGRSRFSVRSSNKNDPHVLNYLGYSNRKAGRLDVGLSYYQKALAIDPNFVLAREYLGEGYVAAGKLDLGTRSIARNRPALRHELRRISGTRRGHLRRELNRRAAAAGYSSRSHSTLLRASGPCARRSRSGGSSWLSS